MGKSKLVRKHLFEADIQVLMELRGLTENKFAPLKGVEPTTYRPRTTAVEWNKICKTREKIKREEEKLSGKPLAAGVKKIEPPKKLKSKARKFIFLSAQNNTYAHKEFFQSVKTWADVNNGEIIVGTFTYNKNGFQNGTKDADDVWIDPILREYINNEQFEIAEGVVWCGDLNILPTAKNPTTGLDNYMGKNTIIIPHAKQQCVPSATNQLDEAKHMLTTGAVTMRNYIQKRVGQLAQWNHIFGAVIVEIDKDGDWLTRNINADSETGCFYDIDTYYTPEFSTKYKSVAGITLPDLHSAKINKRVADMLFGGKNSVLAKLRPEYVTVHDIHDQAWRNHHNIKNPYYMFQQWAKKEESIRDEVKISIDILNKINKYTNDVIVVESNHDKALERWLQEQDYKKDPVNALFFLEMQLINYRMMSEGKTLQTFKKACELVNGGELKNVRFLKTDESYQRNDIEHGAHGDLGANGSRGSIVSFRKSGYKMNIGHGHQSCILDGIFMVGAAVLPEESGYAKGPSSWSVSFIITHNDSKRQLIITRNNKWGS